MQLTMEPVEEILGHAKQLDRHGFDTMWLAEAYPWWRKHSMEARSPSVATLRQSGLICLTSRVWRAAFRGAKIEEIEPPNVYKGAIRCALGR